MEIQTRAVNVRTATVTSWRREYTARLTERQQNIYGTVAGPWLVLYYAHMVRTLRSKPIEEAPQFAKVAARLTRHMNRLGLRERWKNGSLSWVCRTGGRHETLVKLIHVGGGTILFGISKSVVEKNAKLRHISWPAEFTVAPQTHVHFLGFRVGNDDVSERRVKMVLGSVEAQVGHSGLGRSDDQAEHVLDAQLRTLHEEDAMVAGSMAAAVAVLPPEDFNDWEK